MTDPIAEASMITEEYNATVQRITADRSMSDEGRRVQIARAFVQADDGVAAVRDRAATRTADEIARLERTHIGMRADIRPASPGERIARDASFRDGLTRASRAFDEAGQTTRTVNVNGQPTNLSAKSAALIDLLDEAELVGDQIQARAVLAVAYRSRDASALNRFISRHPEADADLTKLWELTDTSGQDVMASLRQEIAMPRPVLPPELECLGAFGVRELAARHS